MNIVRLQKKKVILHFFRYELAELNWIFFNGDCFSVTIIINTLCRLMGITAKIPGEMSIPWFSTSGHSF